MRVLIEHLTKNFEALNGISKLIGLADHSTLIGNGREALISAFLKQNLPEAISYHSGEVMDSKDNRSGQVDIIIHPNSAPRLNLYGALNIFPVETVLACIAVKSNLNSLANALKSCIKVKKLQRPSHQDEAFASLRVEHNWVPYIVFAYDGPSPATLFNNLQACHDNAQASEKINISHFPDLFIVMKGKESYYMKKENHLSVGHFYDKWRFAESGDKVLFTLFEFLLKIVEVATSAPKNYKMPVSDYMKELKPSGFDSLFE